MAGELGVCGPGGQLLLPEVEQATGKLVEGWRIGHGGSFGNGTKRA
jgi:hypothetical protein